MIETARYSPQVFAKMEQHRRFWNGQGPSLLFLPRRIQDLYDLTNYPERFRDPALMLEFELSRARDVAHWPTDGIPTARPSLGTVFVPALLGQAYEVRPGAMPWPGPPLTRDEIRAARLGLENAALMDRVSEFYRLARPHTDVYAYHADTQGVFDVAHLMYGTGIFMDMAVEEERGWVIELLELSLAWYVEITQALKNEIGEPAAEMVHGHGTEQGLYFPDAGTRLSEDTATLVSPAMIERDLIPFMERSAIPFGGAFVHYCGKHDFLFEALCRQPWCRAIDLGNPEKYDLEWLLAICAETQTVFHSRVAPREGEGWRDYVVRIGHAVSRSGARCVVRSLLVPPTERDCQGMLDTFHELT